MGSESRFKEIDDYLPAQRGRALDGGKLELREYQQEALKNLQVMRENKETIALLYQATGTGKTVTAVMDAKRVGGRTLFIAHTMELVNQAYNIIAEGVPQKLEHNDIKWITPAEIPNYNFCPADEEMLEKVKFFIHEGNKSNEKLK